MTKATLRNFTPKKMPRRRNLWVTDALQGAPEARLAEPANPIAFRTGLARENAHRSAK
jgi:hypothetical protein